MLLFCWGEHRTLIQFVSLLMVTCSLSLFFINKTPFVLLFLKDLLISASCSLPHM